MPSSLRSQPDLADMVVLASALELDEQQAASTREERDRRIAATLPAAPVDRAAVALAWCDATRGEAPALEALHERADTAVRLTDFLLGLLGLLLGGSAAFSAFYFDGSGRVNVVLVLALLVVIPGLFLLPFAAATLPASAARRVPGATLAARLGRLLSAGRIALLLWRFFPADLREALQLVSGRWRQHRSLYTHLQKWVLLRWSQLFALCFQISALLATLLLVVFTDLAFGWSTTLSSGDANRDAARVHRLTTLASAPWRWAWPQAAPEAALIRESRYYRVTAETLSRAEAARLGGWWPFVVMCLAVYGLAPRLLTLAWARRRCAVALRLAATESPGFSVVLRRLHRQQLSTRALQPEAGDSPTQSVPTAETVSAPTGLTLAAVINWSGVPADRAAPSAVFGDVPFHAAGGGAAPEDDRRLIADLAPRLDADRAALILVKAWEPPLMDFLDFVRALRGATARSAPLLVLPVGLDGLVALDGASATQLALWQRKLSTLGDPFLRVVNSPREVRS